MRSVARLLYFTSTTTTNMSSIKKHNGYRTYKHEVFETREAKASLKLHAYMIISNDLDVILRHALRADLLIVPSDVHYAIETGAFRCMKAYSDFGATLNMVKPIFYGSSTLPQCAVVNLCKAFDDHIYAMDQLEETGFLLNEWRITDVSIKCAFVFGNLDLCKYLLSQCNTTDLTDGIFYALKLESLPVLEKLIADGHDVNVSRTNDILLCRENKNNDCVYTTVLSKLVRGTRDELLRRIPMIQCLLDNGAAIDAICSQNSDRNATPRQSINRSVVLKEGLTFSDQ